MKRTPLFEEQQKLGARFTEFGGWKMPVQFSSIINEHNAVRQKAGLFDASHMGEFVVSGKNASEFLGKVTVADMNALMQPGRAKYSMLLNENGGVIDDIIIYRRPLDFFVVVNAGNIDKDFAWLRKNLRDEVKLENVSDRFGLLALQGPESQKIMQELVRDDLSLLRHFNFFNPSWKEISPEYSMLARTGYTGEDGFEIFVTNDALKYLWNTILSLGVAPCGLGARDTLRLEAAMPLHGHEITDVITPLEAELDWAISWEKNFIGKDALLKQKKNGLSRFLLAFEMREGIPRAGCEITSSGRKVGAVVSGTFSPALKKGIGMGYVDKPMKPGDALRIVIHNQEKDAVVVKKPFYKRKK